MARVKQIPVLVADHISTEVFVPSSLPVFYTSSVEVLDNDFSTTDVFTPTYLPVLYTSSVAVKDTCLDLLGYWMTSAGESSIPATAIPEFYLTSGTILQSPATYAHWLYPCSVSELGLTAIMIENSSDFEIEEYNADGEIEEFWYFSVFTP